MSAEQCRKCGDDESCPEHRGLCCDCFDLGWGMPIEQLNKERAAKGKPPLVTK